MASSHLAFVCIYIWIHHRREYLAQLIALFSICLLAYLLGSASGDYFNQVTSDYIYRRLGNACAALVWIISHELFVERFKISPLAWILFAGYMLLRAIGAYYRLDNTDYDLLFMLLTYVLPQFVMVGFVLHAIYMIVRGYEADLILERREERVVYVLSASVLLLIIAVNTSIQITRITFPNLVDFNFSGMLIPIYLYSAYTYLAVSGFFFWRFRISLASISSSTTSEPGQLRLENTETIIQKSDISLIEKINQAMEADKLYLQNKLTVKDLADHVASQEFRVRKAINTHLQYRNFSDFVNHFRILEAARRLKETDDPISNIGLDVGYLSLSAFHKAFKEKYASTPKEFRIMAKRNNLADPASTP